MTGRMRFTFLTVIALLMVAASVPAQAESHVRIVRLSYLDGQVQTAHAGQELERAILNTPIVEGTRIVTRNDGLAEVEFEDQSALRLAGNSEVNFRRLVISDTGVKINEVEVLRGVVFFDVRSKSNDVYRAVADGNTFLVRRNTVARISAAPDQLQLAVLRGEVQVENQPQLASVKKNETLTLDPKQPAEYKVAHGTEALPVDAWNSEREAYVNAYGNNQGYGPRSGYGLADLNYYGDYFYAAGYGYVWQPYGFAGSLLGWDPYTNGAWTFSPGFGYLWASAYPWGWLPYHYGSWLFLGNGVGWAWLPGSFGGPWYSTNFVATPVITKTPAGWQAATAPAAPSGNSPKPTILVGKADGSPAYIPGGRIPPNFASVIPGRSARSAAFENQRAAYQSVFGRNAVQHGQAGHVFAAPQSASGMWGFGPVGGSQGGYGGGSSGSTGGHSSGGSGGHGGGSGH